MLVFKYPSKKIKPFIQNRKSTTDLSICNICSCDFSLQDEGGIDGYIGILYFSLCPTCFSGIVDMCDQLRGYDDEINHEQECGK